MRKGATRCGAEPAPQRAAAAAFASVRKHVTVRPIFITDPLRVGKKRMQIAQSKEANHARTQRTRQCKEDFFASA